MGERKAKTKKSKGEEEAAGSIYYFAREQIFKLVVVELR